MRRGHPGYGGWRNENPRHFRPRGGGTPHFRPPRGYGLMEPNRFPPPIPGPRPFLGHSPFSNYQGPIEGHATPDQQNRNMYQSNKHHINHQQSQVRAPQPQHNNRNVFPIFQRMRHGDVPDHSYKYNETPNYYEDKNQNQNLYHRNNIGHHRQPKNAPHQNQDKINQHPSAWINPPFYNDRSLNKPFRHHENDEGYKITGLKTGHRPPSSDHYGGSTSSVIDSSNSFSCSVDDTVNIVRKRLLSRESQHPSDNASLDQCDEHIQEPMPSSYSNVEQEQPKRKVLKQKQKSNCDKIKNKIVHQLFMMDKDKIHKLMDNPNSSTKFEYAISSLITESQNSFNRHLRSVAEKSLCGSSTDFVNNDNNTIYEDTFMKHMQCLLDPQDTVLLEDIKPIVLAELSKVLQLGDFEHGQEIEGATYPPDEHSNYAQDDNEPYNYGNTHDYYPTFSPENDSYYVHNSPQSEYFKSENTVFDKESSQEYDNQQSQFDSPQPLFERRKSRKSRDNSLDRNRRRSEETRKRRERISRDSKSGEEHFRTAGTTLPAPVFDPNSEQFSEDDDPFAELDKQYHVDVDHNFIATDDLTCLQEPDLPQSQNVIQEYSTTYHTPKDPDRTVKKEIDNQLEVMVKSPLKLSLPSSIKTESEHQSTNPKTSIKQESFSGSDISSNNTSILTPTEQEDHTKSKALEVVKLTNDLPPDPKPKDKEKNDIPKFSSMIKSSTPSNPRKRSMDQKPSHRKEKRKKSESQPDKQILNKNIIINVNDCAAKTSEKCETPKSIFNLFFANEKSNKEASKDTKKNDSADKVYSDKYVKRKEDTKKIKDKSTEAKKRTDSNISSHSIQSSTDSHSHTSSRTTKTDTKSKLKSIDMFVEHSRKPNSTHNPVIEHRSKPTSNRKVTGKHVATQVSKKAISKETQTFETRNCTSRFAQTERKKMMTRGSQTDPVSQTESKSTDAFERMKEIDMEIQALLQEKFKLYSSLEARDTGTNTLQSLGMAVLNVKNDANDEEETEASLSEDAIVNDFANIPVVELEAIALEAVQDTTETPDVHKKSRKKNRKQGGKSSPSVTTSKKGKKKSKTPIISLIEQIITDDRPLEEIISLDDLETSPAKSKEKLKKSQPKKKSKKQTKHVKTKPKSTLTAYDIKECYVKVLREDFTKYLQPNPLEIAVEESKAIVEQDINAVEVTVENDLQFDMLDVSEDIIIGDNCEVKSVGKDVIADESACEEIILDNSQSSIEESAEVAASENVCKTYDYSSDETLRRESTTVTGNADVLAIECIDSNFIAACLDGNVYHFTGDGRLITTFRGSNLAVTCLTIVKEKYGTTLYTGSLDSRIRYYDLDTGLEKGPECNVLSPIQTMDRAWDTVFVGTRTGFVLQFECKNNMLIPVSTVKFSEQSILALRALKEGPRKVLLVGARSECVTIKDAQTGLLLRTLEGPKMTVYSILFEDGKVYCGTSSNQIHVFDYVSGSHVGAHEGGKGAVCLRALGGLLFAGCYDGCVYVYREGEPGPFAQLRGPGLMLLSLAIIGNKIIAGYKDRSLYIWKIPVSILQEMIL